MHITDSLCCTPETQYYKSIILQWKFKNKTRFFLGGPVVKNPPANAGDMGLIPAPGRFHKLQGNEPHVPQLLSVST